MSIFAKDTNHESDLNATPEQAWELIGDFNTYPGWNPLAPKLKGKAKAGSRALGWLCLGPRWMKVPFWPRIVTADANRELRWKGGVPLLFVADHRMIIDTEGKSPQMVHKERFSGLLVLPLQPVLKIISNGVYRRYDRALNKAVKLLPAGDEASADSEPAAEAE